MICFDGGGTKGLITLQVLLELQKRLKNPLHHYFDWFVGTSTGSIIASLLSLGYSLKAIQIIYYALKDRVMVGQRPYNSLLLEHVLRNILGPHVRMCDVRKKLLITATLADRSPIQLHLFRSFPSPSEILKNERQYIDRSSCGTSSKSACLTSPKSSAQPTSPATSAKQSSRKKLSSKSSISSESALDNQPLATCSHYFDGLNNANPLFIIRKLNDILSKSNVRQSSPEPSVISSVEVAKDNSSQKAGESSQSISKSVNPTNPPSPFSASNGRSMSKKKKKILSQ